MKLIPLLLLFGALACEGYRILVVFPIPGKSHGILAEGVIRLLLDAGHEVTSIVPFKREKSHPKLTEIIPEENKKFFDENSINIQMIMDKKIDFTDQSFIQGMMLNISKATLMHASVKQLLTDPRDQFDVVISEWLYADANSVLPAVFGCPLIWVSTIEPHWHVMRLVDEPLNPALYTDFYGSAVAPFSFVQRVQNLVSQVLGQIRVNRYSQVEEQFYLEYIVPILKQKGKPVPEYSELVFNASLILGNSHVSMGVPTKLPPSYKDVGGYHINPKVAPLPDDLKTLLDNAKHGVIYFSMGSNLKSKDIPQGVKDGLLKLFGELKQTVLWKFEEVLPNMPKNVHILKWAPQPSILSHPNTILFITHGGLLSTTEAIQFGKPLIGIPVFADQFTNIAKAVNKGFARKVDLAYDMADVLREEIKEVVGNPKYAQRAKEWSLVYHDRPVTPGLELVHWVEHVVKTQGAPHLRSPALMLAWYQRAYLDLAALVLIILIIVAYVLKVVLSKILGGSKSVQKKKKA